ncbi:MAG: hypothetical protein CW691_11015, partial [Candidatus Bathyarchaeum sp.]
FPTVWSLIDSFKEQCLLNNWETCETEDWIKTEDGKYHSFLWTQTIHPSTFERIVTTRRCGIRLDNSYKVVDISYTGWLFQDRPPEFVVSWIKEKPELTQKTAIFDLSDIYAGNNICRRVNETESSVFKEFENFLKKEWDIKFKPVDEMPTLTM